MMMVIFSFLIKSIKKRMDFLTQNTLGSGMNKLPLIHINTWLIKVFWDFSSISPCFACFRSFCRVSLWNTSKGSQIVVLITGIFFTFSKRVLSFISNWVLSGVYTMGFHPLSFSCRAKFIHR